MKFTFITDTHFTSSSNVRAGDFHKDQMDKLQWCVDFTNENDAILLCAGDVFDKPSVADFVKTDVLHILKQLNHPMITIYGNHDILWASEERNYRTSLALTEETEFVKVLKDDMEVDGVILTKNKPLLSKDKPQIMLYHGFLNIEDGVNTVNLTDLQCDTPSLVLLGHDHCVYEDLQYKGSTVIRPGSFTRGIRTDSADRIPEILLIEVEGTQFKVTKHPILAAKQVELLFKSKTRSVEKSQVSYNEIIEQLKKSQMEENSLIEAVKLVTDDQRVHGYIENAVQEQYLKHNK